MMSPAAEQMLKLQKFQLLPPLGVILTVPGSDASIDTEHQLQIKIETTKYMKTNKNKVQYVKMELIKIESSRVISALF